VGGVNLQGLVGLLPSYIIASGRRGEAVELFQTRLVGIPEQLVAQLRHAPFRLALEAIAHTLVYDASVVGDLRLPTAQLRSIKAPTLVVYGGESPAFMGNAAKALADACAVNPGPSTQFGAVGEVSKQDGAGTRGKSFNLPH
jgi:pimeloyl-ACP methyl ester carboxylesterase